jgi:hypothetical protein
MTLYDPNLVQHVTVLDPVEAKETPGYALSWVGGSVLQRLESIKECWITRARWAGNMDEDEYDIYSEEVAGGDEDA